MNPLQTLLAAWAADVGLCRDGNGLHVSKRKKDVPPELLDALLINKAALLAILSKRPEVSEAAGDSSCKS